VLWYKDDAQFKGIDPVTLRGLVDYFCGAIVREPGCTYPVVSKPGPDVMRLRIAITQLVPTQAAPQRSDGCHPIWGGAELASGAATRGGIWQRALS